MQNDETLDELVHLAQSGDRTALGRLLEATQDRMYGTILRVVGHPDDAAELTQETLIRVIRHLDRYDRQSRVTTWMTRIAINLSISFLRKRKLRRAVSLDQASGSEWSRGGRGGGLSGAGGGSGAGKGTSSQATAKSDFGATQDGGQSLAGNLADGRNLGPEECVQRDEMIEKLHQAMDALDEDARAILVMRDLNQMDYQEIAGTLQIALGTVKSRLFRARLALREEMERLVPQTAGLERGEKSASGRNKAEVVS